VDKDFAIGLFGWRQQPGLAERVGQLLKQSPFSLLFFSEGEVPGSGAADVLVFLGDDASAGDLSWTVYWPVIWLAEPDASGFAPRVGAGTEVAFLPVEGTLIWEAMLLPLLSRLTGPEYLSKRMRLVGPVESAWWRLLDKKGSVRWAGDAWHEPLPDRRTATLPPVWEWLNLEPTYWRMCWNALRSGASVAVEAHPVVRAAGGLVYLDWELLPGSQAGIGAAAAVLRARDVTARMDAEIAQERLTRERDQLLNDMGQFVEAASHDLKEPLRNVSNFVQLLRHRYGDQIGSDGADYIAYAVSGVRRMWDLMDELLLFGNLTASRERYRWLLPSDLASDALVELDRPGPLVVRDVPERIFGHPGQLALLFRHLLDNGYRYNPDQDRIVGLEGIEERSYWIISIWDNGPGIAPEYQQRAFALFKRLHSQEEAPGRGMGLSLCRKIADLHGGHIRLSSAPGQGTAVHLWLPKPMASGQKPMKRP